MQAVLAAGFPHLGIAFVGVSLAFGLTVLTIAYAVGHISGGHFNPAVAIGLWSAGRCTTTDGIVYIISLAVFPSAPARSQAGGHWSAPRPYSAASSASNAGAENRLISRPRAQSSSAETYSAFWSAPGNWVSWKARTCSSS